jgi:uncharacterized protein (TIGR04255 family)
MPSYSKPQIREAVIDIHVSGNKRLTLQTIAGIQANIPEDFSIAETETEMEFKVENDQPTLPTEVLALYRMADASRQKIISLSNTSFTNSVLRHYPGWEKYLQETKHLWDIYCTTMQPQVITRIGVRYINELNLPSDDGKVIPHKFLNLKMGLPDSLPNSDKINVAIQQFRIPQPDIMGELILHLGKPVPNSNFFLVDIDIVRRNLNIEVDSEELWSVLQRFRERKNQVFESLITDEMRALLK